MKNKAYTFVILAAGHGKRMNSNLPKVLHKIGNFPMLKHVTYNAKQLDPGNIAIVVDLPLIEKLECFEGVQLITQESMLGTGDAVRTAMRSLRELPGSNIVIVQYGDTPFIRSSTITRMIGCLEGKALVCLGFRTSSKGYGRLIIENDFLREIVEARNGESSGEEFLANAGIMVAYMKDLRNLVEKIECNKLTHEYYLTDIVSIAIKSNLNVGYITVKEEEAAGINDRNELAKAEFFFQESQRKFFTSSGVTLVAPETVFFSFDTQIGIDSIIYPYVFFGPGVKVGSGVKIGPFTKCECTTVGDNAIVGNFVEAKASDIGVNARVKHLSYIGNTKVGTGSNIGAGTVVCNYDGRKKHKTNIGSNCFVGSNSSLIAPLSIHDESIIAAGSIIVKDVPRRRLVMTKRRQVIKKIK
ncbi:NTP transferase domain-containing protein [Wolbachia endosymbiont of Dirofilaria (Dirofilaria) immitis]|uniref:NTP transferase domain-containing protein n=1 Tax=Wolbachia endosymbiont of Dirofilaria (Dirofilaria) immitis TaxID=1812115 RepID=UPI00158A483E|nr:NTP transferase domain-containing protein [Wolbachia endosymbiont of Dirofilaria (Dirofilaria) immitis]QKX02483.1 NTP transferase domain-containing protein [Wolbachia endosymbiont of Dirofilaria (Dirofilaria) immitis]